MTVIQWDDIRRELAAATELVQFEQSDGHDSLALRMRASDHTRTALLLLSGSTMGLIIGHQPGSVHGPPN